MNGRIPETHNITQTISLYPIKEENKNQTVNKLIIKYALFLCYYKITTIQKQNI